MAGALPQALARLGHDVRVVMPLHRGVEAAAGPLRVAVPRVTVPIGDRTVEGALLEGRLGDGVPVYFVAQDGYYDRPALYGASDDCERFVFFCRSVLAALAALGVDAAGRPRERLAGRADPRLPRDALSRHAGVRGRGDGLHGPQPRLPGRVLALRPADDGAGLGPLHAGRARVLRAPVAAQGRPGLRRPPHHGQPDLRPRDPDPRVRRAAGRRAARAERGPRRHPERPRRPGLEPGHGPGPPEAVRPGRPERQGRVHGRAPGARWGCPIPGAGRPSSGW